MSPAMRLHYQYCHHIHVFKNFTERTIRSKRDTFRMFLRRTGIKELHEITLPAVKSYIIDAKIKRKWSPKTIRNVIYDLKTFLDWCVSEDLLVENPIEKLEKPKVPKRLPQSLSKEEALRLLEWAEIANFTYRFERSRALAILGIFIFTGVRRQELLNLKCSQVDLEHKSLFVECGKGQKDRLIPLNFQLIRILKRYKKDRKLFDKTTPYFFASLRDNQAMGAKAIQRLFKKLQNELDIRVHPHLLRHTFATLMLEGGTDIYTLSQFMGHSEITTTALYLSTSLKHRRKQMDMHPLIY